MLLWWYLGASQVLCLGPSPGINAPTLRKIAEHTVEVMQGCISSVQLQGMAFCLLCGLLERWNGECGHPFCT